MAETIVLGLIAACEMAFFGWMLREVRRRYPAQRGR